MTSCDLKQATKTGINEGQKANLDWVVDLAISLN